MNYIWLDWIKIHELQMISIFKNQLINTLKAIQSYTKYLVNLLPKNYFFQKRATGILLWIK